MNVLNTAGVAKGTLRFKMEHITDRTLADMKEAVPAAEHDMRQLQQFEETNSVGRSTNIAARHISSFETQWRPILDYLGILKKAGDHISEVSYSLPSFILAF